MNDDQMIDDTKLEDAQIAASDLAMADAAPDADEVVLDDLVVVDAVSAAPQLVVKRNGAETTDTFDLNPPCVIGRFDPEVGPVDVDLGPLPEGIYVSRKHAKIGFENEEWFIEDLGSSNGTFILNDGQFERVESAPLLDGTEIALGNARFVFHMPA